MKRRQFLEGISAGAMMLSVPAWEATAKISMRQGPDLVVVDSRFAEARYVAAYAAKRQSRSRLLETQGDILQILEGRPVLKDKGKIAAVCGVTNAADLMVMTEYLRGHGLCIQCEHYLDRAEIGERKVRLGAFMSEVWGEGHIPAYQGQLTQKNMVIWRAGA